MKQNKIVLVTHSYPPYTPGQSRPNNDWVRMAKGLAATGWKVTVLCGLSKIPSLSVEDSISVIRLPFPDIPPRALWFQVRNASIIIEMMKRNDVMLTNWDSVPILLPRLAKIRKPVVCVIPGGIQNHLRLRPRPKISDIPVTELLYELLNEFLGRWFVCRDLRFATHIVTDSRHAAEDLERTFNVQLKDRWFVLDRKPIRHPSRSFSARRQTKNYILYVGRLYATKGLMDLLRAFRSIIDHAEFSDLELHILGQGPLIGKMKRLTKSLELDRNVVVFGQVPWEVVFDEMKSAKALVHPSYYESRSVTIDEAQEIMVPIVVPTLPWAKEQCASYPFARYYDAGNIQSLSEQIVAWLENPPVRRSAHSRSQGQGLSEIIKSVALERKAYRHH